MTEPKRKAGRPKAAPTRVTRIRLPVPDDDALQTLGGADYAKVEIVKAIRRDIKKHTKGVKDE